MRVLAVLLIGPLLFYLVKKYPRAALWGALALNMLYEYLVTGSAALQSVHRILFIRYLFITVFGMYFYLWRDRINYWLVAAGACFSLWYITAVDYFDFHWALNAFWQNTCVYASFYFIALVVAAFHFFETRRLPDPLHRVATRIGVSTWHIYLVQMMFFHAGGRQFLPMLPLWGRVAIGVSLCCALGIGWNVLERRFRKKQRSGRAEKK
ncbi:MAG: hypothetical protein Q4C56_00120 [Peptococcaceae bacterium]|nr:hypothetical protein [Peptococcaceae bacterium]